MHLIELTSIENCAFIVNMDHIEFTREDSESVSIYFNSKNYIVIPHKEYKKLIRALYSTAESIS